MTPLPLPKTSLIITTYNREDALDLVLQSVLQQSHLPQQIIIADDGSQPPTAALIKKFIAISPVPIQHLWHPDNGFQRTIILNNAIQHALHPYIIQIDGDVVLHPHFVRDHLILSQPNVFLSGSRTLLSSTLTHQILSTNTMPTLHFFSPHITNRFNTLYLPLLAKNIKPQKQNPQHLAFLVRGCNMSFWKKDLLEVNGYDQNFIGWGREDSELAFRLLIKGCTFKKIKFSAIQYHLFHPENDRTHLIKNDERFQKLVREKRFFCNNGITQLA